MPTTVSRNTFLANLQGGVDLNNTNLQNKLANAGLDLQTVKALDKDGDGQLKGTELQAAFKMVDDFDRNGRASSFKVTGQAGNLYGALMAGRNQCADNTGNNAGNAAGNNGTAGNVQNTTTNPQASKPFYGDAIAKGAAQRVAKDGPNYAYDAAPTSPYKNLSGNKNPGVSRPSWLANNNKCNQFVGDALTQAGVKMPTYKMTDGTEHYMNAERLPHAKGFFDRVTDMKDVKVGDVIVIDYPGKGESTAHTEVVTGINPLRTTGAHSDGAYEMDRTNYMDGAQYNPANRNWQLNGNDVYFLRPTQLLRQ